MGGWVCGCVGVGAWGHGGVGAWGHLGVGVGAGMSAWVWVEGPTSLSPKP